MFTGDQHLYGQVEPLFQKAIAIRKKALDPEHPDVGQSLHDLARFYCFQSLLAQAKPLFQQALAIHKKALGSEHPGVGQCLYGLAQLAQGQYAKAEPLYQQALSIWTKTFGPDHPLVAVVLEDCAQLRTQMRGNSDAADLRAQAKAIRARLAKR